MGRLIYFRWDYRRLKCRLYGLLVHCPVFFRVLSVKLIGRTYNAASCGSYIRSIATTMG